VWDEPRAPVGTSRGARDRVLVVVVVVLAAVEGLIRPDLPWRAASVVLTIALAPTLLGRRDRPLLMVGLAFGAVLLAGLATGGDAPQLYTDAFLLVLPYALVRWGSGREVVLGSAGLVVASVVPVLLRGGGAADLLGGLTVLVAVVTLGAAVRFRARAHVRLLDEVRAREREGLARDLHDTVAHHVSAIAIRAQAGLAVAAAEPGAAVDALRVIEAEASRALGEMRSMVRVLRRDDAAQRAPLPGIADLDGLVRGDRGGPVVEIVRTGDLDDLDAAVAVAVYRLVQESVTNARRHARRATRVDVRVAGEGARVRLRVSDDGDPAPARAPAAPGFGILGMVERAALLGGTCEAGPDAPRGWTVTAVLPRTLAGS
jgi:signal transduction histidine kinase